MSQSISQKREELEARIAEIIESFEDSSGIEIDYVHICKETTAGFRGETEIKITLFYK